MDKGMIRMFQSQTVEQAKGYFRSSLSKADYYMKTRKRMVAFMVRSQSGLD